MTTAATPHGEGTPEPGWEGAASRWVGRLAVGAALAVVTVWGALSTVPALSSSVSEAQQEAQKKRQPQGGEGTQGSDCGDCVDCVDCVDCIDCVDCSSVDCSGLDCGGCDCGGLDCGGLDCGGCDIACAVAPGAATAKAGARCRRGPPWKGALLLGVPLLLFAAWQRMPQRARRPRRDGEAGLGSQSGWPEEGPSVSLENQMEDRMVSSQRQSSQPRVWWQVLVRPLGAMVALGLGVGAVGCVGSTPAPQAGPAIGSSTPPTGAPTSEAPLPPAPASTYVAPLANPVSLQSPVGDVAGLVDRLKPTVVNITSSHIARNDPHEGIPMGNLMPFRQSPERRSKSLGTGFIVDPAGFIVTNAHVVAGADDIQVRLSDEREFAARVIGKDSKLDLALLKLENASGLAAAVMGDSDGLRVGEWVIAIGNPFGLGHTVTLGITSAKGRSIGAGPYDAFIQTDASINPGNSGGPLFNLKGEVVGIPTAIRQGAQGIGFAVPVNALKEVLPQLRDKGTVSRGKLGVRIQPLTNELAQGFGLPKTTGALVSNIEPNSASAKAGIQPGDVITHVNGLEVPHADDLPRMVARHQPGTKIKLSVIRAGKSTSLDAVLDPLVDEPDDEPSPNPTPRPPTPEPQSRLGIQIDDAPNNAGARIRVVSPTSTAAGQLLPGDVIVEINKQPVRNTGEVMKKTENVASGQVLLLKVRRGTDHRFVALKVK